MFLISRIVVVSSGNVKIDVERVITTSYGVKVPFLAAFEMMNIKKGSIQLILHRFEELEAFAHGHKQSAYLISAATCT